MNLSTHAARLKFIALVLAFGAVARGVFAQASLTVDVDKPGHPVSPTLWGIFFEDINLSADGGIYPELVRNRSFEDGDTPEYWQLVGDKSGMTIDSSQPLNPFNRHCLRIKADGGFALENDGYWGMNIVNGDSYHFKMAARVADGFRSPITVKILSSTGQTLASGEIAGLTGAWKYHTLELPAAGGDPKAKLELSATGQGTLFLDMVSLLPANTWKGHGLRADLAQSLDALHPAFMRFPGGNWVEGDDLAHNYHWKTTIGDIDARTPLWNTWGYNTTQGLGFHEYLQLCEDLGAAPLFCINAGMSLHGSVPMGQMGQWVQDALDALEYANGPTNSVWGGIRAKNGHPAPFGLKYMEIGNENGGADYRRRWALIYHAIKDKYPAMQLVADVWNGHPRTPPPDLIDEHYYESPESFMRRATQYDSYDRNGPKIFVGEYAVTQHAGKGNLRAAIGEAAFMTGLERNSDIVAMASYAPLFVNLNHRAWNPDLINFDSARWYGLPSYYVQQMFSRNRGDVTLPITVQSGEMVEKPASGRIGVGTWNTEAEFKDIKVTAPDGKVLFASNFSQDAGGWKFLGDGDWKVQDGALRQTAEKEFVRALAGDQSWTDYTLELKARKLGGREGFLILFHVNDDEDRVWWNLGGWNNSQDAVEMDETLDGKPGFIETGRWYDIRLEVKGGTIQCRLDGKLIHDLRKPRAVTRRLFAGATRDDLSGDIILKVVNAFGEKIDAAVHLNGASQLARTGRAIVLCSDNPADENSLDAPAKVSPKTQTFDLSGPDFHHVFPGNSLTVLRLGAQKGTP